MIDILEPRKLWGYFKEISNIPRASKKEEAISQFIYDFGNSLGLETIQDNLGNVLIKKPATVGKENYPIITLQGHLDMVHQKEPNFDFDFSSRGIELLVEDDWITANRTTLGADNGIGVASIMAVLSSEEIDHPPLEAIFTIDEEMGMTGAMGLSDSILKGSVLLNLDSEEDNVLCIGCAGGVDVLTEGVYEEVIPPKEQQFFQVKISGLSGGHSGVDIHLNHANAILVTAELLFSISKKINFQLGSIKAGDLTNVIPTNCLSIISIPKEQKDLFYKLIEIENAKFKYRFKNTDSKLKIEINSIDALEKVINESSKDSFIKGVLELPNGVLKWTPGLDNLVQTSNNIARVQFANGVLELCSHARSSIDSERDAIITTINSIFPDYKTTGIGPYPGWKPKPDSRILDVAKKCYIAQNNSEPIVNSIHAGLECGIIFEKYPNMQMISFGPNIFYAHTPKEKVQISSTKKFWSLLVSILESVEITE
ncbi:aminoacyl-histidine dipeptidase [Flavobacteriaceae bacterium]|nr:aminoacyl-histidine dipeptidase [Flavobacteriaceae bacterium]